jgi:hypothetical protein
MSTKASPLFQGRFGRMFRSLPAAALAVNTQNAGIPGNTSFVANDLDGFQSSLADIFVDAGVTNTSVIGRQGRVEDHGAGTVVVPMR